MGEYFLCTYGSFTDSEVGNKSITTKDVLRLLRAEVDGGRSEESRRVLWVGERSADRVPDPSGAVTRPRGTPSGVSGRWTGRGVPGTSGVLFPTVNTSRSPDLFRAVATVESRRPGRGNYQGDGSHGCLVFASSSPVGV